MTAAKRSAIIGGLVALAGCSPPDATLALDEVSGCVPTRGLLDTRVVDERTVDFVYGRNPERIQRNQLTNACRDLAREGDIFIDNRGSQICPGTQITVLAAGRPIPGSVCTLGGFTPQATTRR